MGCAPVTFQRSPGGAPEADPAWLQAHRCGVRVIDVREPAELAGGVGRIPGAELVPLSHLARHALHWGHDEALVLVCRSGRRSARGVARLEAMGFHRAASLTGGMLAWEALRLGVDRGAAPVELDGTLGDETLRIVIDPSVPASLRETVASLRAARWTSAAALLLDGTEGCIDGRAQHPVLGAPGGDAGELLLALAALEESAGVRLDDAHVEAVFDAYVQSFGRFYLHSDTHAMERLGAALATDPRLASLPTPRDVAALRSWVLRPPPAAEAALLDLLTRPAHVGCGHLRGLLEDPAGYGVRPGLVEAVLRSAFRKSWREPEAVDFDVLEGRHDEAAVVEVLLAGEVHAHTRVPMLVPHAGGRGLFVHHPGVEAFARAETRDFLLDASASLLGVEGVGPARFARTLDALAERQLRLTLSRLARGLPTIELRVVGDGATARVAPPR